MAGLILISVMWPFGQALAALGASVTLASGQPTDIYPGEVTQLQITLSNSNSVAAVTGVGFSNSLPAGTLPNGLKVAGVPTYTCIDPAGPTPLAGVGTLTAIIGTQTITLGNDGVIPARSSVNNTDGSCTIIIPVTAGTSTGSAATYTYTIAGGGVTGNDGGAVSNSGAVSQSVIVNALTQPSISKNFVSSTLVLGSSATTMNITVTNTNPVAIPNFSFTDNFPNIIKIAATPGATSSCNNGGSAPTFSPVAGLKSLTASGTIPAKVGPTNGSCTFSVQVDADNTAGVFSTTATNSINGLTQFSNDLGIRASSASAGVTVRSPLRVTKAVNAGSLATGEAGTFTITLFNDGPSPLTANFTDSQIDGNAGFSGLNVTGASTTCDGGTASAIAGNQGVTLTNGVILASSSCTVTINFTGVVQIPNTPTAYTNSLLQSAVDVGDSAIVSQSASAAVTVYENLYVEKTISPANAGPGNPVRYQVTVQNWSAAAISNVAITDSLTNGQTFLTGTIGSNNYTPSLSGTGCIGLSVTGVVGSISPVLTIGTLPQRASVNAPGSCTVTFWAMTSVAAVNGAAYENVLLHDSVCYNPGSGNICNGEDSNPVSGTVTAPVLSASKSFSPSGALSEGTIRRLTIVLSNLSANSLTSVALNDTLQAAQAGTGQLRIATPANAATTCGGSPVITAVANSTSLAMNGATIPARASNGTGAAGSCVVQVDVVGPAGIYNNVATGIAGNGTYADGTTHTVGPLNSNTATITYNSTLSASKSFVPTGVSSGGTSTVTVRLSNSGAVALTNVAVTDPLPSGMVLATPVTAYTTCAGSTAITAVGGASSISLTGAAIAGSGSCDLVFEVRATGGANWTNTIPVNNITADGGVSNQTAVSATLTNTPGTGLTVAKATDPSTLTFPGEVSRLTITIRNDDVSQAVSGLRLTDYFTIDGTSGAAVNGMAIAATPVASTTCTGGTITAIPGAASVEISGVSMAASSFCTLGVNVTSTSVGGITNYIPAGAIINNQGLTNSGQATTSLTTQSNIGVTKQFTPNVVKPGERSRLRITFYNPTAQPGTNLAVIDNLPAGVTVPSGPNPATTCTGATVSSPVNTQVQVSGGSIVSASGGVAASCYAEIDVVVSAQGDYVNTIAAGAASATIGGTTATNSQPTTDTLRAKAPLSIHKAFSNQTLDAGNPVGFTTGSDTKAPGASATMTIRIDNPNAINLTSTNFTDNLPTGLVVATTPGASTTCAGGVVNAVASATTVRLTGATIPVSSFCTVTVSVLSNISGSYVNTIPAGGVTTFEGVSNEEPTSARLVVSTPPIVSKQFAPAVIPPNGTSTLTIVLGNSNSSAITLTSAFVDTLPTAPGAIVVAATPNVVKTCPGVVTATADSGTVTYASGATVPAGGCTISVDVRGATPGDHTNNIPAGALQTNFGNNQQPANAVLSISTLGYVSGRVFQDNNVTPNGVYNSGTDTPLSGVSIELHSGADCSGALVNVVGLTNPVTTDALGNYMFSGLPAGTYSVCEPVQPAGTTNSTTTAGGITTVSGSTGTAGTASNPTSTSSRVANIVLGSGGGGSVSGSAGNNFAEIVLSSISGKVFLDINNNGVQNGADANIAGVTIELLDSTNTVIATTTTDASGNYSFTGLVPSTYSVRQPVQPTGTSNGITSAGSVPNGGTAGTASAVTTTPSQISTIVLPPNTASTGNNFAEIPNGRSLSGRVFLDYDNNGALNGPDHGIGGQVINLTGTDINGNTVTRTTTTASDGSYSFTALPEGTYAVTQPAQPAGTTNGITTAGSTGGSATGTTPSEITAISLVGANTVSANNDFAEMPDVAPDLAIAKTHSPASFGDGSSTGFFTITPSNIGTVATTGVVTVVDTLPAGMTVAATATGTGWVCSGAVGASTVTCTSNTAISAGGTGNPITLRVAVAAGTAGQILTNTAVISGGGEPPGFEGNNTATDPVVVSTTAQVSGTVWLDANHNRILDVGETTSPLIAGWQVELLLGGVQVATTATNASGYYDFTGIAPGSGYTIRFRHPTTGLIWGNALPNEQGLSPVSGVRDNPSMAVTGTNGGNPAGATLSGNGTLSSLTLFAGDNIVQQSLPLDPAGVVYDAVTRNPVAGAVVTISGPGVFDPATDLVGGVASVITGVDGFYQFLLTPDAPTGIYTLEITTYPGGYVPLPSTLIPVCGNVLTVGNLPDPALVQSSNIAPTAVAPAHDPAACPVNTAALAVGNQASTQHYFQFNITILTSADVLNNHIPIDPILGGAIVITKTTPLVNVSRGDLVPYTITAMNTLSAALSNIDIRDQVPPGFKYKKGTASVDGVAKEPTVSGRDLTWPNEIFAAGQKRVFRLMLVVGSGVGEGEYVNRAFALNNLVGASVSNTATATVRVVPDPTFDCSDLIGKVFDDKNANGYQDEGELGIANVRLATVNGLLVTTDDQGRFHITCAEVPNEFRGSNFVMKLDERTLPSGYRVTTENPRDVRMTRGKLNKLNFGAAIHRVFRVELSNDAFNANESVMTDGLAAAVAALPEKLRGQVSVVRLAYDASGEDEKLVRSRLKQVRTALEKIWKESGCCYALSFEEEIFERKANKKGGVK